MQVICYFICFILHILANIFFRSYGSFLVLPGTYVRVSSFVLRKIGMVLPECSFRVSFSVSCIVLSCLISAFGMNSLLCVLALSYVIRPVTSFTVISFSSNNLPDKTVSALEVRFFKAINFARAMLSQSFSSSQEFSTSPVSN